MTCPLPGLECCELTGRPDLTLCFTSDNDRSSAGNSFAPMLHRAHIPTSTGSQDMAKVLEQKDIHWTNIQLSPYFTYSPRGYEGICRMFSYQHMTLDFGLSTRTQPETGTTFSSRISKSWCHSDVIDTVLIKQNLFLCLLCCWLRVGVCYSNLILVYHVRTFIIIVI